MIKLNGITKSYHMGKQSLQVLKGINLHIRDGEFVSIMGPSGSGKSTLLNILGILDTYDEGTYELSNHLIKDLNEKQRAGYRNRLLGFVFQSFNLLPFKNAMENVALPLYYQKVSRQKRNALALEYLDKLGMKDRAMHMPAELSGGQQQRVAIARALITEPGVLLADEPTGALDSATTEEVMSLLIDLNKMGKTVVIVTHERDVANQTKRQIHIRDGMIESDTESIQDII